MVMHLDAPAGTSFETHADTDTARHWIDGAWTGSAEIRESRNPSTGEVVGRYAAGGAAEARAAIAAARRAFDTTSWSRSSELRSRVLSEMADRLEERVEQIALAITRGMGKIVSQTTWEVAGSVTSLRYASASALTQVYGRAAEIPEGTHLRTDLEATGVAGIISPWNSPVLLTVRALGPALAAGCTTVVKLPAQTALANQLFSEVVAATTSLPAGVVNIFTEAGNEGAPLMVESPDVDVISYTGSTHVGRQIAATGAKTLKRMNLELGGKTPLVVFEDADLDAAVPQLVGALTLMNGQFCVTGSRVLVQRSVADVVRARLSEQVAAVRVGPSEDPDSQMGPVVDAASANRLQRLVDEASAYATTLVPGGLVTDGPLAGGAFFRPALLEVDDLDAPLVQQELFGPVQTFEIFDDEADAVRRANATEFGLAASIFTRDEDRARRVGRRIRAGLVWTNTWGVVGDHFEEGGFKASGIGNLRGPRAIEAFQEMKTYAQVARAGA